MDLNSHRMFAEQSQFRLEYGLLTVSLGALALSFQFGAHEPSFYSYLLFLSWVTLFLSCLMGGMRIYERSAFEGLFLDHAERAEAIRSRLGYLEGKLLVMEADPSREREELDLMRKRMDDVEELQKASNAISAEFKSMKGSSQNRMAFQLVFLVAGVFFHGLYSALNILKA